MSISIGDALLKLGVDTKAFESDMNQAQSKVDQAFNKWGKRMAIAGAAIVGSVVAVSGASIKMAMDAVESENLFEVAMGGMAESTRQWSNELSSALGLNSYEIRENVATLYQMASSMGLSSEASATLSKGLTELAYDMASFYNLDPEEAFNKLRAGISGETEPLKRLGILVDETTVKNVAYTEGIAKQGEELTQQQKVQARYIAIMQQTSNAQGDLGRTLDSPTNQLRVLQSQIKETSINLGMAMLPAMQKVLNLIKPVVTGLSSWVKEHGNLAAAILAVVGAGGALLIFLGLMPKILIGFDAIREAIHLFRIALHGLNLSFHGTRIAAIAMWAGITLGISLAIAGGIALWQNWDKVKNFFVNAASIMKIAMLKAALGILDGLSKITKFIPGLNSKVDEARDKLAGMIDEETFQKRAEEAVKASETIIKALNEEKEGLAEKHQAEIDSINKEFGDYAEIAEFKIRQAKEVQEAEAKALDQRIADAEKAHAELLRQEKEYSESALEELNNRVAARKAELEQQRTDAQQAYDDQISDLRRTYGVLEGYDEDYTETKMDMARRASEERAEQLDEEMDAEHRAYDERIAMIDAEYSARIKLIDEEAAADIEALNWEIDRIRRQQEAEDRAREELADNEKKAELEAAVAQAETDEDRAKAQEKLDDFLEDLATKRRRQQRNDQIDQLRDEIDNIRKVANSKKDILQAELEEKRTHEQDMLNETLGRLQSEKDGLAAALEEELIRLEEERRASEDTAKSKLDNTLAQIETEKKALDVQLEEELKKIERHVTDINEATAGLKDRTVTITTVHRDVYESSGGGGGGGGSGTSGGGGGGGGGGIITAQHGGLIREPSLISRLSDMKPYMIAGESGPERISPIDRLGGVSVLVTGNTFSIRDDRDAELVAEQIVEKARRKLGYRG